MFWLLILLVILWALAYFKASLPINTAVLAALLFMVTLQGDFSIGTQLIWIVFLMTASVLNFPSLRQHFISQHAFKIMQMAIPKISRTEREALEAGDTWWEAELFSGDPNWTVLDDLPEVTLTKEEQAFIEGPVETLCAMLNDWEITHKHQDLPADVWDFIKKNKFCGMIIPKKYDGLEFSHFAHSEVVIKIASRSTSAGVTVMVPNSLGPAKLLLGYGTEAQKDYYLPRLAIGKDIPAFALTGPNAGSDAGSIPDTGIVCQQKFEGKNNVLGIRLNWDKRYITLGPVATVLGMAFKLYDPNQLIGDQKELGITVALIPTKTKGVSIGRRHFPLDSAFQNGPNWGKDVFIPMDWIIGGQAQVGNGWKMLMQCLATGRAISLPALSTAAVKFTSRNTGAYARIRKQFNLPIGEFEGVQEALARIAGQTYLIDAARKISVAALDAGKQPSVISAIIKYELTERMRGVLNDGMDVQGGSGICLGPKNYMGRLYQVIPVSITVEGANILTRTMMIFGQGAVRCHPFIQKEIAALDTNDLPEFDRLLFQHAGFSLHNLAATAWLALTNAHWLKIKADKDTQRYYQLISRFSVAFALLSDYGLLTLGGALKRKERISGRFADALSNLYLCSCVLKHYKEQGSLQEDKPLMDWACQHTLFQVQQALAALLDKLPFAPVVYALRLILFPLGKRLSEPNDALEEKIARLLLDDSATRDRLTAGIYINNNPDDATGRLEVAFQAVLNAASVEKKLHEAKKQKQLSKGLSQEQLIKEALAKKIISANEAELLTIAEIARSKAIAVDDFSNKELS
ncbi:MAG: acyl-CoA dehydrogenase [Methylococcales bacterium]|nr:acyl-CoA dehydrogenase [Methylococcales bacterium]